MNKYQPGDAVYVVGPSEMLHLRMVEWTHPDGDLTVKFHPDNKGEPQKVSANSVIYADASLKLFSYSHLPEKLQAASKPFARLAHQIVLETLSLPMDARNVAQMTIALQKLLEAKDAAVRARLP